MISVYKAITEEFFSRGSQFKLNIFIMFLNHSRISVRPALQSNTTCYSLSPQIYLILLHILPQPPKKRSIIS